MKSIAPRLPNTWGIWTPKTYHPFNAVHLRRSPRRLGYLKFPIFSIPRAGPRRLPVNSPASDRPLKHSRRWVGGSFSRRWHRHEIRNRFRIHAAIRFRHAARSGKGGMWKCVLWKLLVIYGCFGFFSRFWGLGGLVFFCFFFAGVGKIEENQQFLFWLWRQITGFFKGNFADFVCGAMILYIV